MYAANSNDRIDMTIRMQKALDPRAKESKPIVGEGGESVDGFWKDSANTPVVTYESVDDPPSGLHPSGLIIIKTALECRWRN